MVANPAVVHLFGIPSEQIIGHRLGDLVGRTDSGGQQENLIQKFQAKDTQVSSFQFEREGKTLSVSLAPVAEIGEGGSGRVAVFRDFTREAELNRLKDLFFSMMTHELRTPLNAILGYTDMLRVGVYGEVNSEQDQTLGRIMANGKRMLNLVNNLLDQAQIKTGQLSLRIEPFSLRDLLNGLDSVMRVLADSKKIELEIHTEADMPSLLEGDPKRLEQILINLTGNAIKFTTEGKVTVRVYRHDSVYWAIAVSDTGPGIPPQYHDAIFESFKQVDDPITRQHVGTGLGLSIVKQLVTLSGGRITLSSEVGMGSTFTVILPFEPKKQTAQVAQTT
jgi:signal transduction histidine kinase